MAIRAAVTSFPNLLAIHYACLSLAPSDAILFAFDLIELDGEDFRLLPLGKRKARLARLLARLAPGIELNEYTDADGAAVFRQACKMGLEGIVSKRVTALGIGSR
jgi:bifunctional non-homologous end joining protein LigD